MTKRSIATLLLTSLLALAAGPDTVRHQDPRLESDAEVKPVAKFDPRLKALWLNALASPEADLKRQAADAIARAHALGMPGLCDAIPPLLAALEAPEGHPVVRLTAARALIALDARRAAPALMAYARSGGFAASRLVEPALSGWDHAPMRAVWLARLKDPETPRGSLLLAVQAAARLKLADAAPGLRRLALDARQAGDVRLEAARALAVVQPAGLEADAERLVSAENVLDRLVAAALLANHRGPAAEKLLLRLAGDREPAVATVAARRLLEIAPAALPPGLASSPDAELRLLAARALAGRRTAEAVGQLGGLLDDPHRDVRVLACEALVRLAETGSLAEPVRAAVLRVLAADGPRGLEQAATAAGALRHTPAADRLVALLDHDEPEVRLAAAWALRRLAVPATAAAILRRLQVETDKPRTPTPRPTLADAPVVDHFGHLEHLIEALGVLRHRPAVSLLSRYLPPVPIPRPPGDPPVWRTKLRAAAVWSLGQIGESAPPADVVATLRKRLNGEPFEMGGVKTWLHDDGLVRVQVAVSLGRMKVKEAVPDLRRFYQDETTMPGIRRACPWALERITGEAVPALKLPRTPREVWHRGWFLEPVGPP